jgi:hypothetical protein
MEDLNRRNANDHNLTFQPFAIYNPFLEIVIRKLQKTSQDITSPYNGYSLVRPCDEEN